MKEIKQVQTCKTLLYNLGRYQKIKLLKYSNLNNRERRILYDRFIEGLSVKECSEKMNLEESSFNKAQQKAFIKLYSWLITNDITDLRQILSILN